MTNFDAARPFIKVEVEDRHGIYIVRVGNWRLVKDLETGEGEWEWIGQKRFEQGMRTINSFDFRGEGKRELLSGNIDSLTLPGVENSP